MRKVNTKKIIFILVQPLLVPAILIGILLLLVSYITDIFYIGIANEDKSNMKQELKYYTQAEYTKEDCDSFFSSVESFISNLFKYLTVSNIISFVSYGRPLIICTTTSIFLSRKFFTHSSNSFKV